MTEDGVHGIEIEKRRGTDTVKLLGKRGEDIEEQKHRGNRKK